MGTEKAGFCDGREGGVYARKGRGTACQCERLALRIGFKNGLTAL